jgi:hypothetical protein
VRKTIVGLLVVTFGFQISSFEAAAKQPTVTSPVIVATYKRIGLTGKVGPVKLYTPTQWGTFRVSFILVLTKANGNPEPYWEGSVNFHDGAGNNSQRYPFGLGLGTEKRHTVSEDLPIRSAPLWPISVTVTPSGDVSNTEYNMFVVVEQLM